MKNLFPILVLLTTLVLAGCLQDDCTETRSFFRYDPVYYTTGQIRADIDVQAPRRLEQPGKIYFYNNHMFINEQAEGFHIYDISDMANPTAVSFVPILGNFDIAIKDGFLYADNVVDIVVLDVRDINNISQVDRVENYVDRWYNESLGYYSHNRKTPRQTVLDCSEDGFGDDNFWSGDVFFSANETGQFIDVAAGGDASSGNTGIGGSFARFTIVGDFMYTVDNSTLHAWDIQSRTTPSLESSTQLGWGIETIFPYGDKLFIGSTSGMHIFDASEPAAPYRLSLFEHARACDPVVVQGDVAYVTLRNGTECEGFINQLDIVDVSDLLRPELIQSHPMDNPHGVGVRGEVLYLGEGGHGLKSFDISDSHTIDLLDHVKDHHVYDVISLSSTRLMVVGDDGFYIYDSSDPRDLRVLSSILVDRP